MAKKEVFHLTEGDIKNIAQSAIRRILREGSYETSDAFCWDEIKEYVGAEGMLEMLWNYMDSDQVQDFLDYAEGELSADGISLPRSEDDDSWQDDADDEWTEDDEEMYGYDEDDDETYINDEDDDEWSRKGW